MLSFRHGQSGSLPESQSIATASIPVKQSQLAATSSTSTAPSLSSGLHTSAVRHSSYTPAELTIWGMTMKIVREEGGVRGLYRGLVTTAVSCISTFYPESI